SNPIQPKSPIRIAAPKRRPKRSKGRSTVAKSPTGRMRKLEERKQLTSAAEDVNEQLTDLAIASEMFFGRILQEEFLQELQQKIQHSMDRVAGLMTCILPVIGKATGPKPLGSDGRITKDSNGIRGA